MGPLMIILKLMIGNIYIKYNNLWGSSKLSRVMVSQEALHVCLRE